MVKKDVQDTLALGVILILAPLIIYAVNLVLKPAEFTAVASISSHVGLIGVLLCIYALAKQKA